MYYIMRKKARLCNLNREKKKWNFKNSVFIKSNEYLPKPTLPGCKEIHERVAKAHNNKLIYNQWQSKPKKFLKECDRCQKESGPRCCGSALVALKALAEGRGEVSPRLVGTDQHRSECCILYGSSLSSGQSDCIWAQAVVLHETVSPHLCLAVAFCPAVNKAGSSCLPPLFCPGRSHTQTSSA